MLPVEHGIRWSVVECDGRGMPALAAQADFGAYHINNK
jgi:hypothetical protein